jgi:hypothetical protein
MNKTQMNIGGEYPLSIDSICKRDNEADFSYLEDFHKVFFSSGRGSLRALLRLINGENALLPNYICQSVISAFEQEGYSIVFYPINADYSFDIKSVEDLIPVADVFFMIHYFGFLQNQAVIDSLKQVCVKNSTIIVEDTTHSIFTTPLTCGTYAIASLRKWFGLPDGAVVYSYDSHINYLNQYLSTDTGFTNLRLIGMLQKNAYLSGLSGNPDQHLSLLEAAEKYLVGHPSLACISELSWQMLCGLKPKKMIDCRRNNYKLLYNAISHGSTADIASPALDENTCPLFLVVKTARRDALRLFLMKHQIFCPVHWPVEDQRLLEDDGLRENFGKNLSIPIDQRYNPAHMRHIAGVLQEFKNYA